MISINLIRQYLFCPRIVYYNILTNIKPIYPKHVKLGNEYHNLQNELLNSRKFKKLNIQYTKILSNKYLENEDLNISGIVDLAFITNNEIIPIEFKNIDKKYSYGHILQLVGYGILLEKKYNKSFKQAFIIYGKNLKFHKIKITTKYKNDFFKIIDKINYIVDTEIFPNSSANEKKCSQCEYLNYCDDRI